MKQTVESAFIPQWGIVVWKALETHSSNLDTDSSTLEQTYTQVQPNRLGPPKHNGHGMNMDSSLQGPAYEKGFFPCKVLLEGKIRSHLKR